MYVLYLFRKAKLSSDKCGTYFKQMTNVRTSADGSRKKEELGLVLSYSSHVEVFDESGKSFDLHVCNGAQVLDVKTGS